MLCNFQDSAHGWSFWLSHETQAFSSTGHSRRSVSPQYSLAMSFSDVGRGLHRWMLGHISLTRTYEHFCNKQAPPDQ